MYIAIASFISHTLREAREKQPHGEKRDLISKETTQNLPSSLFFKAALHAQ
jgi:hypothetical protein